MLLILKVVLQVLTVASAALTSTLDYKWHDKRTTKFKKSRNLLYLVTAALLLLSIGVTIFDDVENDRKEKQLTTDLKKVQDQNDGLQKGISILSDKSSDLLDEQRNSFLSVLQDQRQIGLDTALKIDTSTDALNTGIKEGIKKQGNLLDQQKTTLSNLTGGDSYCYLTVGFIEDDSIILILHNAGDFPLYDILIEMSDRDVIKTIEQKQLQGQALWDFIRSNTTTFEQRTISPNLSKFLGMVSLKGVAQKRLRINIWTRYKSFGQDMKLVKQNGEWLFAYRVTETPARVKGGQKPRVKELLLEKPKNFPVDKNGDIDW